MEQRDFGLFIGPNAQSRPIEDLGKGFAFLDGSTKFVGKNLNITLLHMKRLLFLAALCLMICMNAIGQTKVTRVILKNGTVLTGRLVEIDPSSHLVLSIADVDTRIEMEKVASIEAVEQEVLPEKNDLVENSFIEVLDVPESFVIDLDGTQVEMLLIRGGDFMMGFDGRHSLEYYSEPVHPVRLSSFYVCKEVLTNEQVTILTGKKPAFSGAKGHYKTRKWSQATFVVETLAERTHYPLRLITEAEWEYLATSQHAYSFIWGVDENEWCLDFFQEPYPETREPIVNPTGPATGKCHVMREWDISGNEIYKRKNEYYAGEQAAIRVVMPAAEYR